MSNSRLTNIINDILLIKIGGDTLNKSVSPPIFNELQDYCKNVGNSETDLNNYVINNNQSTEICKSNYTNLKKFIDDNKNYIEYNLIFNINDNQYIDYYDLQEKSMSELTFKKIYKCYEYNEDIIKAYEMPFIYSRFGIYHFMEDQKQYLKTLNNIDKRIIADYTKLDSFNFYKKYKSCQASGDFTEFDNYPKFFGDSFYHQIYTYYKQNNSSSCDELFKQYAGKYYDDWIINDRIGKDQLSRFSDELTNEDWKKVLDLFIDDLCIIINNAPIIRFPITFFRGSTIHYIIGNDDTSLGDDEDYVFISDRISSYTFDFNTAYNTFSFNEETGEHGIVYRTCLMPFSKALLVAPVSVFPQEYEIISAPGSIFTYNNNRTTIDPNIKDAYNNYNKKCDICSNSGSFRSLDTILINTPLEQEFKILSEILNNNKKLKDRIKSITNDNELNTYINILMKNVIENHRHIFDEQKISKYKEILKQPMKFENYVTGKVYSVLQGLSNYYDTIIECNRLRK